MSFLLAFLLSGGYEPVVTVPADRAARGPPRSASRLGRLLRRHGCPPPVTGGGGGRAAGVDGQAAPGLAQGVLDVRVRDGAVHVGGDAQRGPVSRASLDRKSVV